MSGRQRLNLQQIRVEQELSATSRGCASVLSDIFREPMFKLPVVRQNLVNMMRAHHGAKRVISSLVASGLERDFKRLARRRSTLAVGQEMAVDYRRVSDRVHSFMPCLIDDDQYRSFANNGGARNSRKLIAVGRLSPEKGHRYLLEAIAILKSRGLKYDLDVVGSGPLEDQLRTMAANFGLDGQVQFHGYVGFGPNLFELYKRAGMAVLPSLTEGLPQVINETLAIGLPTIATQVGGIPHFLCSGDTALLVPPADSSALASAIQELASDNELAERLRVNGRRLMGENTLEANRAIVLKVIRDEVHGTRGPLPKCA